MKDVSTAFSYDLTNLTRDVWLEKLDDTAEDFGHFEPVSPHHNAAFIDAGRTLFVCFEDIETIRAQNPGAAPLGWSFARESNWSSLTLLAPKPDDWFRHPAVFGYFDRIIDDGFFDDFDQVLFYGAGPAGYAAAAFSVAAPDAQVLLIQPQASLDMEIAGWDRRFPKARRLDFKTRYGFAPDMVELAQRVTVVYDPDIIEDAVHAQMFSGANTTHLRAPYIDRNAAGHFNTMGILAPMIRDAMNSALTPTAFAQYWRVRQRYLPYLRAMFHRLNDEGKHPRLLARLCRKVGGRGRRPMFAEKFEELRKRGIKL